MLGLGSGCAARSPPLRARFHRPRSLTDGPTRQVRVKDRVWSILEFGVSIRVEVMVRVSDGTRPM